MWGISCVAGGRGAGGGGANSFVTVEGRGVGVTESGDIWYDVGSTDPIRVTARSGWLVNGRESVTLDPSSGTVGGLDVTSRLQEDSQHIHVFPCVTDNAHVRDIVIGAQASPSRLAAMYAVPDVGTVVSASASKRVVTKGLHHVTRRYSPCACGESMPGFSCEEWDEEVVPDRYEWVASAAGQTFGLPTWTGTMTKGLGQAIDFRVTGKRDACTACACQAHATAEVDVHELSIERPDYLGLDLTDAMRGRYVTRTATAKIDPEPTRVAYNWTNCGRCVFIDATDGANVTYGGTDKTGASASFLAEPLTVSASVWNGTGQSATASCTTNFTVVAVDVKLDGVDESGEERTPPSVYYIADKDDGSLSKTGFRCLKPVSVTCTPQNLPYGEAVGVAIQTGTKLYEITGTNSSVLAKSSYPCGEVSGVKFGIHGHSLSLTEALMAVCHAPSEARDFGRVKVVEPPPLEIAVDLISPSGKWPYDPVWHDPVWSLSFNGVTNMVCATNDDCAMVKYSLNKNASDGLITIKKSALVFTTSVGDCEVDSFEEGVHQGKWIMPKELSEGSYFAEFVAFDAENGEKHSTKSEAGAVVRGDFYTAETKRENQIGIKITELDVDKDGLLRGCVISVFVAMPFLALPNAPVYALGGAAVQGMLGHYVNKQLPDWINKNTYGLVWEWETTHWKWNEDASKYEEAKDSSLSIPAADPDFGSVTLETKGKFLIGYASFRTAKAYDADGKLASKLVTCESGYYSYEYQRIGILGSNADAPKYYNLEKSWRWSARPYGLKEPKIEE